MGEFLLILRVILDTASGALLTCIITTCIIPAILLNLCYNIPSLMKFYKKGEVLRRGWILTFCRTILWSALIVAIYFVLYLIDIRVYELALSIPALIAGGVFFVLRTIHKFVHKDTLIVKSFYTHYYMKYVSPNALRLPTE